MQYDPKFATSPIFVTNKDYEFSINPELITLIEYDPFHGYESKTVVAHLTKLNDIATLFAHEEKNSLLYILNLFPFSLKDFSFSLTNNFLRSSLSLQAKKSLAVSSSINNPQEQQAIHI